MKGKLLVTLQFILLFALALLPRSKDSSPVRSLLAALLAFFALFILIRAFRELGSALTPLPESKEGANLVTSGIYSQIRHPIYSALFILALAAYLWKLSGSVLIAALLLTALLLYKARYEDQILERKFPESIAFQESIPAFLPRLRKGKNL
jgi:protein-S-isoprenylcysteine O-methyltransferase Ste14